MRIDNTKISKSDVDGLYVRLDSDAKQSGYNLNPDMEFTKELVEGLLINERRYGYWACPCRLASGDKEEDMDIICPCDYRDQDIDEYGQCYCALYVSKAVAAGEMKTRVIPERRPTAEGQENASKAPKIAMPSSPAYPVWRCKVCGYLCARDSAPDVCPICKAGKERFERFM